MHPITPVKRTHRYNMFLILLSIVPAAIVIAISIIRSHVSFGSFTRTGIDKEDIAIAKGRAEQSRTASPMKQFLVVVLPDGKVVNPMDSYQL